MPEATPLPDFFGRLTTVRSQHEHLGATLRNLEAASDALEIGRTSFPAELSPGALLTALRGDLAQHFEAEESDVHFGTIAREEPRLLPGIVDLKGDHAAMLASIDGLLLVAADQSRWLELVVPIRRLIRALRVHERAEALLLQESFGRGDVEARAAGL
ncbi:MAG TPA: hemerythrin domain-containing protein [Polyangiaceae bacterium]|nr:hemerythrin domain-containing protein [Polyangiaceae bacterium]